MLGQEHSWDKLWKRAKQILLTASVVFNVLVISFVAGSVAWRFGLLKGKKPVVAKDRVSDTPVLAAWPKQDDKRPVIAFEQVNSRAEVHPQARQLLAEAGRNQRTYGWNYSLHYRPADSAFFYLAELATERCDCEGNPFAKIGLQLFLNPYDGGVFFVDTIRNVPPALAVKE